MSILLELNLISSDSHAGFQILHKDTGTCMYVRVYMYLLADLCVVGLQLASTVLILMWFTLLPMSLVYSISMGFIL